MRYGPVLTVTLVACAAAAAGWYWLKQAPAPTQAPQSRRGAQRDGSVPVTVETVSEETVPGLP
jgi:hypothetical protein